MKKQSLIFLLVLIFSSLLICIVAKGQNNYEDVVYLKNGNIIHGVIIEQIVNVSVKIQTADRSVYVYKMDEIEKITKEPIPPQPRRTSRPVIDHIKQKGQTCILEWCYDRYRFEYHEISMATGFEVSLGYLFNPYFSLSGSIGYQLMDDEHCVPLLIDLRVNLLNKPITPYIGVEAGYTLRLSDNRDCTGGLRINTSFGMKFFVSDNTAMIVSLGYKYQEFDYNYPSYYSDPNYVEKFNYLNFSVGITF